MLTKNTHIINHLLILILLALSGFPIVSSNDNMYLLIGFVITLILSISVIKENHNYKYFIVFFLISVVHILTVKGTDLSTYIGMFVRLTIGYIIINKLKFTFYETYVKTMYIIGIISIVIFISSIYFAFIFNFLWNIGISVTEEGRVEQKSLIIYNFISSDLRRNSGPFWEPAAFGVYLLIALFFELILQIKPNKYRIALFSICIISTQSTTTLIGLVFIIFVYNFTKVKSFNYRLLVFLFTLGFSIFSYVTFSVLGEKIATQISDAKDYRNLNGTEYNSQRFISTLVDLYDFQKSPLFGTGPSKEARFSNSIEKDSIVRTNGWMDLLVKFGIFGSLFYFVGLYKNITKYNFLILKNKMSISYFFIILLLIISSAENIFYYPLFWALSIGINKSNLNSSKYFNTRFFYKERLNKLNLEKS